MTRWGAVVGPLLLVAMVGLVVLVVAGVGDRWPARAGIRTIAVSRGPGPFGLVVDSANGRLLRTVAIGPPRGLGPAVVDGHDGRLFLVNWLTGAILVLNAHTGRVVRTILVGGVRTNLVVSQRLGRVFVSTTGPSGLRVTTGHEGNGSVDVLDGRSGIIVRTWPVGLLPGAMAVDERHRYLVVLNLNGSDRGPGPWAWIPAWLRRWLPFLPRVPVPQTVARSVTVIDLSHV